MDFILDQKDPLSIRTDAIWSIALEPFKKASELNVTTTAATTTTATTTASFRKFETPRLKTIFASKAKDNEKEDNLLKLATRTK